MAVRAVWRPPWYAWALLGLAALALIPKVAPDKFHGYGRVLIPLLVVAGVLFLRWLWEVPPAPIMCAAIVLTIFSGAWRQMGLEGLPFDRLLLLFVVFQLLLRAPGVAHTPRLQIRNVHLLMCLTVMYVLASAVAAGTLTNELSAITLVDQFGVLPYVAFLVAPAVFAGARERNMLLVTLVGLGAYLGFTAIFESVGPHGLIFPHYIARIDAQLAEARADGPFQNAVAEGIATFDCAVAAVMAYVQWRGQWRRYLAAIVAVVCVFGCFLTFERGVWVAAVAATVVVALVTPTGRRWLVPGVVVCAVAIGGTLLTFPTLAQRTSTRAQDQLSVWDRQNQTSAGLRMVEAKPLFGFGWNRYESDSVEYFRQAPDYPLTGFSTSEKPLPLHDVYLTYAVELGLIGASLWVIALFWGVGGAILGWRSSVLRQWKLGLLALAVFFVVVGVFNPDQTPFPTMLLWVWAGVAWGSASLQTQQRRTKMAVQVPSKLAWTSV